jgi:hypothetical protein
MPLSGLTLTAVLANVMIGRGYRLVLSGFDTLLPLCAAGEVLNAIDRGD